MPRNTKHELRCFCSRGPLLAVYGLDNGELYIHIKIYKQTRVFGEVYVKSGEVKMRCRECLRWHRVVIRQPGEATLQETTVDIPSPEGG